MLMSESRRENQVLNLSDLTQFESRGIELGVVGCPVKHSLSPSMHHAALRKLAGKDPSFELWHYGAYELHPEELSQGIKIFREKGFRGINLTVPHKVEVLPLLDEIDPVAERMGAVNTLLFDGAILKGFNSDGYGIERAIEEAFGRGLAGREVLILGAGGAARATAVQCLESGAGSVWITNRTISKAEKIVSALRDKRGIIKAVSLSEVTERIHAGTLVINATSLGLSPNDPSPVAVRDLPDHCLFFDMIYNPQETRFLREGATRGFSTSNGLGMLVHQGVRSLELWTGYTADAAIMRRACEEALGLTDTN